MTEPSGARAEFCAFLARILAGQLTVADWNCHVVTRYADTQLEAARRQLSRHAVLCGQCSAQPTSAGMEELAKSLLEQLESEVR